MLQTSGATTSNGGFDADALTGYNLEDGDTNLHADGVHRQHLPMVKSFGGYPSNLYGECHNRPSQLGLLFPLGLGAEEYPTGRRINEDEAAKELVWRIESRAIDLCPTVALELNILRLIVDCVVVGIFAGNYGELEERVRGLWRLTDLHGKIGLAHHAVLNALLDLGKDIPPVAIPMLSDLVN
jgi:hypothetical protein